MASVTFYADAPWGPADDRWRSSNRALRRLIDHHRADLEHTTGIGHRIRCSLESLFPIFDTLCRSTCQWCPEPCCIVNKVWIDFQDLLFWHLIECDIPPGQLKSTEREPCRYLKHRGCMLPRLIRPWGCTQYICSAQRKRLIEDNCAGENFVDQTIQAIRLARFDLEASFVDIVLCDRHQSAAESH